MLFLSQNDNTAQTNQNIYAKLYTQNTFKYGSLNEEKHELSLDFSIFHPSSAVYIYNI